MNPEKNSQRKDEKKFNRSTGSHVQLLCHMGKLNKKIAMRVKRAGFFCLLLSVFRRTILSYILLSRTAKLIIPFAFLSFVCYTQGQEMTGRK